MFQCAQNARARRSGGVDWQRTQTQTSSICVCVSIVDFLNLVYKTVARRDLFRRRICGPKEICTSRTDNQRCLLRRCSRKIDKKGHPCTKVPCTPSPGCSIMTMLPATLLDASMSLWQSTTWQTCCSPLELRTPSKDVCWVAMRWFF